MALRSLLVLIWLLASSLQAFAAIAFDAASSTSPGTVNGASLTHTASGSNRLAILCLTFGGVSGDTATAHTYGGVNMPLIGGSAASGGGAYLYQLVAPATGSATVSLSFNQFVTDVRFGVVTLTGVHQTTPLGTLASALNDNAGPASVNVSTAVDDWVIDCMKGGNSSVSITVGAGQTARWEYDPGGVLPSGSSTAIAVSGTTTMSWTFPSTTSWDLAAINVKPAAAAAPVVRRKGPMVLQ